MFTPNMMPRRLGVHAVEKDCVERETFRDEAYADGDTAEYWPGWLEVRVLGRAKPERSARPGITSDRAYERAVARYGR